MGDNDTMEAVDVVDAHMEREIEEAGRRYRADLEELHEIDGRSTEHTPEQTEESMLTPDELEKLWAAEDEIRHGIAAYLRVAEALHAIQTGRLYREDYRTFGEYCRDKWNLTDRHARNMANAWEIALDIDADPIANAESLPANERQARELKPVPRERRAEVWEAAVGHAGGIAHVCAHDVKWAREELIDGPAAAEAAEAAEAARLEAAMNPTPDMAEVDRHVRDVVTEVTVHDVDAVSHAHRIINRHGSQYAEELAVEILNIIQQKMDTEEQRS